jgi:cytochrome c peroxidase
MRGGIRTWTNSAALAVACALIGGALLRPSHAAEGQALHGAMPMDEQLSRLEQLQGQIDVTKPPAGMDDVIYALFIPKDNAMTPERVALGKKLYFDTRLSADNTVACATCHDVSRGFTDQRPVSEGIRDQLGRRNAPTTPNTFVLQSLFLDGRAPSLEEQAKLPIINPVEMGQPDGAAAVKAIADDPDYQQRFQ